MTLPSTRFSVPVVFTALAGFMAGFAAMRVMKIEAPEAIPGNSATMGQVRPASRAMDASSPEKSRVSGLIALLEKPSSNARDIALYRTLQEFDAADFQSGADDFLALLRRRAEMNGAEDLGEAWMDRWLEIDPAGALGFAAKSGMIEQLDPKGEWLQNRWLRSPAYSGAFRAIARKHPEWAKARLADLKAGPQRDLGVYLLLNQVAQADAVKARQFLAGFSGGPNRSAAVDGYVRGLASVDARAGFEAAITEPPGPFRDKLLTFAMQNAPRHGVAAVRELLDRIDDPAQRRELARSALSSFAEKSSESPLPWLKKESAQLAATGGPDADKWMTALELSRASERSETASWALALSRDPKREVFSAIVGTWTWRDPEGFQTWLAESATKLDASAIESLHLPLMDFVSRVPAQTQKWADALPSGPLRDQAQFTLALASGAEGDLAHAEAAYRAVATSDTKGYMARHGVFAVAGHDGVYGRHRDIAWGSAPAQFVMALPPGPGRTLAIQTVADLWGENDPKRAAAWLNEMPMGAERDTAVHQFVKQVVNANPGVAADWVEQVADPATREKAAQDMFQAWSGNDPVAARAWLRALPGVREEWKARFLRTAQ
jgi:hypothetical protein